MGVHFTLPVELRGERTMDNAILVYSHDRTSFLRLLYTIPSEIIFQEVVAVFRLFLHATQRLIIVTIRHLSPDL